MVIGGGNASSVFAGKDYRTTVSNNCCIAHADQATEGQDCVLGSNCNSPGPFSQGPELGGEGCTDSNNQNSAQLTLYQTGP